MKRNRWPLAAVALSTTALLTAAALPASASVAAPSQAVTAPNPAAQNPVPALTRAAHPLVSTEPVSDLNDLRALGPMVGAASVVGVGEATHSSHEFFTLKHRIFRALVEQKGFTTFALEASWSTGLSLDR